MHGYATVPVLQCVVK